MPSMLWLGLFREVRRIFAFDAGAHACPGAALATTGARAGVAHLLAAGADPGRPATPVTYRPSHNARVALSPMG